MIKKLQLVTFFCCEVAFFIDISVFLSAFFFKISPFSEGFARFLP
jgi:hypothetical protein